MKTFTILTLLLSSICSSAAEKKVETKNPTAVIKTLFKDLLLKKY